MVTALQRTYFFASVTKKGFRPLVFEELRTCASCSREAAAVISSESSFAML